MKTNLELNLDRINVNAQTAWTLNKTMRINRPTFEAILWACMLEVAWNKAIQSAGKMVAIMSGTIEWLSDSLTEQTISNSKSTFEISSQPALSAPSMEKNRLLIWQAIEDLEAQKKLILEAPKEKTI